MKQKAIVLACAAAMILPVLAQAANVEIYGKARLAMVYADNADSKADNQDTSLAITSYSSRLGFKGSEDLGNGLTAIYQYETKIEMDEKEDPSNRDTFIGLKGGFGTVKMGRLSMPYKAATSGFDPFNDTEGDFNGGGEYIIGHNTRVNNAVAFISNDMSGIKYAVAYATSVGDANVDGNDELDQSTGEADTGAISGMVSYTSGDLFVSAAYESIGQSTGASNKNAAKVAMRYTFGKDKVGVVIDRLSNQEATLLFNFDHKMSDNYSLYAAVAMRGENNNNQDAMSFVTFGAKHAYSKNVEVYALYARIGNDNNSRVSLKKAKAVPGENISAISVGMNLKFSTK